MTSQELQQLRQQAILDQQAAWAADDAAAAADALADKARQANSDAWTALTVTLPQTFKDMQAAAQKGAADAQQAYGAAMDAATTAHMLAYAAQAKADASAAAVKQPGTVLT